MLKERADAPHRLMPGKIGDVLVAQGNLPEALKSFRDGLAIRERLAKVDPNNAGWQRNLSYSYTQIGDVLVSRGSGFVL
jgi:hypothetical protein